MTTVYTIPVPSYAQHQAAPGYSPRHYYGWSVHRLQPSLPAKYGFSMSVC
jgi:hypothetical protein